MMDNMANIGDYLIIVVMLLFHKLLTILFYFLLFTILRRVFKMLQNVESFCLQLILKIQ